VQSQWFKVVWVEDVIKNFHTIEDFDVMEKQLKSNKETMHVVFTDVEPATTSELILQQKFREAHEKMTSYFQSSIPKYSCISCLQIVSKLHCKTYKPKSKQMSI